MIGQPVERMTPHSVEVEEAVLGSILIDPECLHRVSLLLRAGDFYIVKNRWVYEACLALSERREPIDFVTVTEELDRRGQLAEVGGPAFVSHLVNAVPTAIHAEGYARIVERKALRRRLLQMCSDVVQLAYDEATDEDAVLDRAEQAFLAIARRATLRGPRALPDAVRSYFERIKYLYEHCDKPLGIPTGLIDLDRLLGGLQKSDLILVAARPSVGKTTLLLNIAFNAYKLLGAHVLIFSMEMSESQIVERLVSQTSGIDSQRLRWGHLNDDDWPKFVQATGDLSADGRGLIWIDDTPSLTPLQLRSITRRHALRYPVDLIAIDYLQLMTGDGRGENRAQEMSAISRAVKRLARELDVPVLAASQLSRAVEGRAEKRPILSDLKESGSLEQDADVVIFIYRDDLYNPGSERKNVAELIVAKHRKGPTGVVEAIVRKELTQFVSAARREVVPEDR